MQSCKHCKQRVDICVHVNLTDIFSLFRIPLLPTVVPHLRCLWMGTRIWYRKDGQEKAQVSARVQLVDPLPSPKRKPLLAWAKTETKHSLSGTSKRLHFTFCLDFDKGFSLFSAASKTIQIKISSDDDEVSVSCLSRFLTYSNSIAELISGRQLYLFCRRTKAHGYRYIIQSSAGERYPSIDLGDQYAGCWFHIAIKSNCDGQARSCEENTVCSFFSRACPGIR